MIRKIILDTETTGLDPKQGHKIVEIAALEMKNRVLTGNSFHTYINPERNMPDEAYRIHGIAGEFLKDKPLFMDISDKFLAFIEDSPLVIHNAPFDLKFLNHELLVVNNSLIESERAIDTLIMARKTFPGMKVNLDALCERFNIDNSHRRLHGAFKDATLLAHIYVELLGGRQAKLDFSPSERLVSNDIKKYKINAQKKSLVIHPTQEEKNLHKLFLEKIANPNWLK